MKKSCGECSIKGYSINCRTCGGSGYVKPLNPCSVCGRDHWKENTKFPGMCIRCAKKPKKVFNDILNEELK